MALVKQPIPIQFGQGLDTKTDKKSVLPGKLLVLENAVFKKKNRLDKRNGNRKISNLTVDGTELPTGSALEVFNDELLQYANQTLYSYSEGIDRWVSKGSAVSAIVRTKQIIKNTATQTQADSAYINGVGVYAWEDSRGGVRASVIDESTGAILLADVSLDASASRARCVAFNQFLFVFYYKSGSLYVRRLNPLEPTAFDAAVTVSSTVNTTSPNYDVYAYQNLRILFAHNVQGASEIKAGWVSDTPAVLTGALAAVTITGAATGCLGIVPGPSSTFYIAFFDGTDLKVGIYNNGLGQLYAPFDAHTAPADDVVNVTGYKLTDNTGVQLIYELDDTSDHNQYTGQVEIASGGTAGTPADFLLSVGLASKAWTYTDADGNENHYVGVVHSSALQATYFVARHDGLVVAKQQYSLASGLTSRPILANVWSPASGIYSYVLLNKVQLISENATLFTPTGVAKTSLDFTNQDVFTAAQLGNNLHIVGGVLGMYDGQSVVEHGFHLYPENLSGADSASGGSMSDGTYLYVGVYEWTDNFGQVHQSAPSVPLSVVVNGGGSSQSVTITFPTLRLTAKQDDRSNVSLVVYRTEAAGTDLFYRVTSVTSPTMNDPTADTVAIVDTLADASIISNQLLYTTGGVLEHYAPPACSGITEFQNRIVLTGLEDANDVWFSKEFKTNEPVGFSDQLKKTVASKGGGIVCPAVIDDKLLVFKTDRYYYTYGEGPNNTGQFGDFQEPSFVTADVGCTNAQSVVQWPGGLMLRTAKGIYAIDSTLTPSYIGDAVEDFNHLTISSANLVAEFNQIRFTTSDGVALVYDYYEKQWSTFTAHEATDAVVWQEQYVVLKTNGVTWREDPTYFKDAGAPYRVRIGTGWLAAAGAVGFQRVYKIFLLGEYLSQHRLQVKVGYDFSPAYTDTIPVDPDTSLEIACYGDGATYGADAVYGGANNAYRFSAGLRIQKCQSIRFLIEEKVTSATEGSQQSFTISTLGLLVGMKAGLAKLRARQTIATE